MIISHKHKFVFVKTRKTAGSTLESLLYPYLDKKTDICTGSERDGTPKLNTKSMDGHMTYSNIIQLLNSEQIKNYFFFAIERNPWDKTVSAYWWHKHIKPLEAKHFNENYIRSNIIPKDWERYTLKNIIAVNKVFLYEEIKYMYHFLNDKFNFNITDLQINNTRKKGNLNKTQHYSDMYNSNTKELVEKIFYREIEKFNYRYEAI